MPIVVLLCVLALGGVGVLIVVGVVMYNSLVRLRVVVDEAEADIDTFLKQRYDMIPNLVEIVKGYAKHEKGTFERVTELRSKAMQAGDLGEKAAYENQLTQTLKSLFAVAENYPELKADANFRDLQDKLSTLEDNIQKSRRFYNATVRDYNTKISILPYSLFAGMLNFHPRPFFEAAEEETENVKVSFADEEEK